MAVKHTVTGDQYRDVSRKMREILRQLDQKGGSPLDPEWVSEKLQEIIELNGYCVTLEQAINILGQGKVISDEQSAKSWERFPPILAIIHYREKTLRQCAKENEKGEDWRLVYCHGLSLREQRAKCGVDQSNQPCFYNNDRWLKVSEDSWANYKPQAGYYLINFRGQFDDQNWNQQEQEIAKLGKEYERCHETVFSEAILTIFMVNGERIAEDWYHWGVSLDSSDDRVDVGDFFAGGLYVSYGRHDGSDRSLRVALARKFDH